MRCRVCSKYLLAAVSKSKKMCWIKTKGSLQVAIAETEINKVGFYYEATRLEE